MVNIFSQVETLRRLKIFIFFLWNHALLDIYDCSPF